MRIAWYNANVVEWSGYGHIGTKLREGVKKRGITITPSTDWEWDAMVICSPPNALMLGPTPRPDVILHTMFEAEPVPEAWVKVMNRVGLIWSPSTYCANLFTQSGVTTPIVVGGYGVDTGSFTPISRRGRTGTFKVRLLADHLVSRKNVMRTIKVFLEANLPDATLEVKLNDNLFNRGNLLDDDMHPISNILVRTEPMDRDELVQWLHDGDLMLYLSGGEGYGLIPLEAMATGIPLICAANTGMMEYLSHDSAILIHDKGRMPAVSYIQNFNNPDLTVVEPDWDAAVARLRWAYLNREHAYTIGEHGAKRAEQFTWDAAWDRAASIVQSFVEERSSERTGVH